MGLVTPFRGGSETRPACHDAGLPGAGCPGRGSVVRDHEARDRTELKAARPLARAAVERREASRPLPYPPPQAGEGIGGGGAAAKRSQAATSACVSAATTMRLSALRLPSWEANGE